MTFDDYFSLILDSEPKDWEHTGCWGSGSGPSYKNMFTMWGSGGNKRTNIDIESHSAIATFKKDLNISLAWGITVNDDFQEDWANSNADPKASSHLIDFFFGSTLVTRQYYVSVDGGRAMLPIPKIEWDEATKKPRSLSISESEDKFFTLFNRINKAVILEYEKYREGADFQIVSRKWPR